ncbi:hypothetical protein GIB67_025744 [Kingdonia uniflora]|uniref:Myosin motor domain-containing protein n=1 Tax=Kingdonia uniflora TaxID=39325 RepID=A0A7J7MYS9_9MAGN|nr:hypothetical protein GIB67_025744 [Kingdonia uniflora]
MDIIRITEHEQDAIFRVVVVILHLGNIDFAKGKEIDSSVVKDEKSRFHLKMTAERLMALLGGFNGLEELEVKLPTFAIMGEKN